LIGAVFGVVFGLLITASPRVWAEAPSAQLQSVEFTSDHHLICRNKTDLLTGGERYPEVQWRRSPEVNAPVTQTGGLQARVRVRLTFGLENVAADTPFLLIGSSDEPGLCFRNEGRTWLGRPQSLVCEGLNPLGRQVRKIRAAIRWSLTLSPEAPEQRTIDLGMTGPHVIYTTLDTPRVGDDPRCQVTDIRMDLVVERLALAQKRAGLNASPPRLVYELMRQNGEHYLPTRHYGKELAWKVPESWAMNPRGASCISIVEFVGLLCKMGGVTGETETAFFYARETDPLKPLRGGLGDPPLYKTSTTGEKWQLFLVDDMNSQKGQLGGYGGMNYYEATLDYTVSGKHYYFPGGTDRVFDDPLQVVRVFRTLAWATWDDTAKEWVVREVVHTYHRGLDDLPRSITLP
jgi:hypothetical protein